MSDNELKFEFMLSTLNLLGRGLYRSFATVLAEAISNAWDADATWVDIKFDSDSLTILDNGIGMSHQDMQGKFLQIGYSKRDESELSVLNQRRVLGRKGIGKLAYMKLADTMSIVSQKKEEEKASFKLNQDDLENNINKNVDPQKYSLPRADREVEESLELESGTLIRFEGLRGRLRRKNIRENLATHFHFSHMLRGSDEFEIIVNGTKIGLDDLNYLRKKVQFVWFIDEQSQKDFGHEARGDSTSKVSILDKTFIYNKQEISIQGYIASVFKPTDLHIPDSNDFDDYSKAGIALFSGGRLREADLLGKASIARIPENYLFGQIHVDIMDTGDEDIFTTSRDGVIADDPLYQELIKFVRDALQTIVAQWTKWRDEEGDSGDSENESITIAENRLITLWLKQHSDVDKKLIKMIRDYMKFSEGNIESYVGSFVTENFMRAYIHKNNISLIEDIREEINRRKNSIRKKKNEAHIDFEIREDWLGDGKDLSYLDFTTLATIIDDGKNLSEDHKIGIEAERQKLIRNALMHTARLTEEAKKKVNTYWGNVIKKIAGLMTR